MKFGSLAAFLEKIRGYAAGHSWPGTLLVFLAAFAIYLPLQRGSGFADPDALYHLKMAELIASHGPVRDFLWLPYSTLASAFADQHFLYHVALIPFIKLLGPLAGMKLATASFAAGAIAALSWAMRYLGVRYAPLFALLSAVMNPLAFRIGLSKASAMGVAFLVVGLAFAARRRIWSLAAVAFVYVWTHGSWPSLVGLGTVTIIIVSWGSGLRATCHKLSASLLALWGGALAGLVVNPYFPQSLKFYWEQIVQIALVNYQDKIGVGSEWYPYAPHDLVSALPLLALLVIVAIFVFPFAFHGGGEKESFRRRAALALSFAALAFLAMTLRSQRHVEYFVPLAIAAAASWITLPRYGGMVFARKHAAPLLLAACGCLAMVGAYAARGLQKAGRDLNGAYGFTLYQKAAEYLKEHAAPGEIIVHADWDDMPSLMYWDDANRYIMGLDPTFTYRAGESRYWDYVNFTFGRVKDPAAIMSELGGRYVFSDREHSSLDRMLVNSGKFVRVYADQEAEIYLLR